MRKTSWKTEQKNGWRIKFLILFCIKMQSMNIIYKICFSLFRKSSYDKEDSRKHIYLNLNTYDSRFVSF